MSGLRLFAIAFLLLAVFLSPQAVTAVEDGQFALSGQVGAVHLMGDLGDAAADNFAVGANIAYGLLDWLGVELDGCYSYHDEKDKEENGDLRLQFIQVSAGPRFTAGWRVASIWGAVGPGAILTMANVEYHDSEDEKVEKDHNMAVVSATVSAGVDFHIADAFHLGILGRGSYGFGEFNYGSPDGTRSEPPFILGAMARGTILF